MLDIKLIRENPEFVKTNLKKRVGYDIKIVDKVIKLDNDWREEKGALDKLKAEKNAENKKIADVKKAGGDVNKILDSVKKNCRKKLKKKKMNQLKLKTKEMKF